MPHPSVPAKRPSVLYYSDWPNTWTRGENIVAEERPKYLRFTVAERRFNVAVYVGLIDVGVIRKVGYLDTVGWYRSSKNIIAEWLFWGNSTPRLIYAFDFYDNLFRRRDFYVNNENTYKKNLSFVGGAGAGAAAQPGKCGGKERERWIESRVGEGKCGEKEDSGKKKRI